MDQAEQFYLLSRDENIGFSHCLAIHENIITTLQTGAEHGPPFDQIIFGEDDLKRVTVHVTTAWIMHRRFTRF